MNIEVNKAELTIIKKALSDLIDANLSEAQEIYIRNIDKGMPEYEASTIFKKDNNKEWAYLVLEKQDPLYCLFDRLFGSPASEEENDNRYRKTDYSNKGENPNYRSTKKS